MSSRLLMVSSMTPMTFMTWVSSTSLVRNSAIVVTCLTFENNPFRSAFVSNSLPLNTTFADEISSNYRTTHTIHSTHTHMAILKLKHRVVFLSWEANRKTSVPYMTELRVAITIYTRAHHGDEIPERDVAYHLTYLLIYHWTTTHL